MATNEPIIVGQGRPIEPDLLAAARRDATATERSRCLALVRQQGTKHGGYSTEIARLIAAIERGEEAKP